MLASGYTAAEVASRLGVSTSTIYSALEEWKDK
jgi:transposase